MHKGIKAALIINCENMFYIKAPTGQVPLHILEKCICARIEYLQLLYEDKAHEFNGNFEYLLENTLYDRVGHFTLRLLVSVSQDLYNHWIMTETLLFQTRLNHILPRQLHRLFRTILRHLKYLADKENLIHNTLIDICSFFSKPFIFKHFVSKNHTEECNFYKTKVRYELVPDLVKKRKVQLNAGYAIIQCSKWKTILTSLFTTYIMKELQYLKSKAHCIINQDMRFDYLYYKIHSKLIQVKHVHGCITKENIDAEVNNFPLCMQHLHMKLRSTHRLSHYARLYYSLFLKDSGMPIQDAICYWKEEYSKPHSCNSVCVHNWQSNERKFIYSIRHIYGLEGSRRNYSSPTCEGMCATASSPIYEGGCPFKNFDINTLKNLLCLSLSNDQVSKLLNIISPLNPQIACAQFFKVLNQSNTNYSVVNSPLQYYLTMINQIRNT